jgi:hypothetical protein
MAGLMVRQSIKGWTAAQIFVWTTQSRWSTNLTVLNRLGLTATIRSVKLSSSWWLNHKVWGEVVEEAILDEHNGMLMGTPEYLFNIDITRCLQNWVSMFGQKIKFTHNAFPRLVVGCRRCFYLHSGELECAKRSSENYVKQLNFDNPDIEEGSFDEDMNFDLTLIFLRILL